MLTLLHSAPEFVLSAWRDKWYLYYVSDTSELAESSRSARIVVGKPTRQSTELEAIFS